VLISCEENNGVGKGRVRERMVRGRGGWGKIVVFLRRSLLSTSGATQLVFAYPFRFGKSGFSAYFLRQIGILISGFYPDFFVQVRIGPYILFSNCKVTLAM